MSFTPASAAFSSRPRVSRFRAFALGCGVLASSAISAVAANREVKIQAPSSVAAGATVTISVSANTDAGDGEQLGFFHAEYSADGGKTWKGFSYATNEGTSASHTAIFKAGDAGSSALVRVLVAFRGGKAGDVDYTGKPIEWEKSWNKWQVPPAKLATINVVAK